MNDDYIVLREAVPYAELALSAGASQKLVKLLPLGLVHSLKGEFLVDGESYQSIVSRFDERKLQIPIDYEHQTLKDVQAPAAGWITSFVLKSDGIYGAVDWTEPATKYLQNREYRYLSPVILTRPSDRKVIGFHSAALTNTPAIDGMTPIVNSDKPETIPAEEAEPNAEGDPMNKLLALLHLDSTASIEDVCDAVAALLANQEGLQLKADAAQFEVTRTKADAAVMDGLKAGKLLPFQKDAAFQSAMKDLPAFSLWLKSAPQVVPMGEVNYGSHAQRQPKLSKVHELMGLTAEDVEKYGKN